MKSICVFCGSSPGRDEAYTRAAWEMGDTLARNDMTLVYGGAQIGLMGSVADAALAAGGKVIGVLPRALMARELGHHGLTELKVVDSMAERKDVMMSLADAFVALPGGLGTLDELFEVWTANQLSQLNKPCGLLNVLGFFDPLLAFLDQTVAAGFIAPAHRGVLRVDDNPSRLLAAFNPA